MEVKPGYKQTDVGVIPEDWIVKRLGEIATVATGNTPPTRDVANYGDEFPFVSPVDLGDAKHITFTEKRLSKKGFEISRRFPKGSILFVCIGSTIGKCGLASTELTSNQQINAILPSSKFSTDYLYYFLCEVAAKISAVAGAQAVPIINKTQFSETAVALPSLPEQHAIAAALGDVDELLVALTRLITKKRDLEQATMQELLTGKRRLPGFAKAAIGYKQTEVGVISEDWEVKQLRSLVRNHNSGIYKKRELYGVGCNIVGVSDLYSVEGVDGQAFSNVPLSQQERVKFTLQQNDLLYGESSLVREGIARTVYVTARGAGTAFAWHTRRYSIDQRYLLSPYLYYYLQSPPARRYMIDHSIQTAITGINTVAYFGCPIISPPLREQEAIAKVLSDMGAEIATLEQRRDKTRALKQGMMQELLTGRTRLV